MSVNEGNSNSPPVSREEETREDSSRSRSLKDATHKLKAEALRRLQLGDAEYDNESGKHNEGSSADDVVNKTAGIESDSRTDIEKEGSKDLSKARGDDFDDDRYEAVDSDINKSQETASHTKDSSKSNDISEGNTQLKAGSGDLGEQESVSFAKGSVEPSTEHGNRNVAGGELSSEEGGNKESGPSGSHRDAEEEKPASTSGSASGKTSTDVRGRNLADGKLSLEQGASKERNSTSESEGPPRFDSATDKGYPGSRRGSASSRPGSGRSTPRSGPRRLASGEKGQKTTSSRPGSGTRSRPGSGVSKQRDLGNEGRRQDVANTTAGDPASEESHVRGLSERDVGAKAQINVKNSGSNVNSDKDTSLSLNDGKTGILHLQSNDLPEQQPILHADAANTAASGTLTSSLSHTKVESGFSGAEFSELSDESKSKHDLDGGDEIRDKVSPPVNESNADKFQGGGSAYGSSQISDFVHSDHKQDPGKGEDSEVTAEEAAVRENKDAAETLQKEGLSGGSHEAPGRSEVHMEVDKKDVSKGGPEEDPVEFVKETAEGKEVSDQANEVKAETEKPADPEPSEGDVKGTGVSDEAEGKVENIGEGVSEVDQSGTEGNASEETKTKKGGTKEKSADQGGGGIDDEEEGEGEEHAKIEEQYDAAKTEQPVLLVEGQEESSERILPEDFCYDFEELVSRPFSTEGIPADLLSFHHSFGYECTKRSNLHVLDENSVLFSAGNMVEILNLKTQEQSYMRTTGGGGIGAVAVHPSRVYFAVAEKGTKPNINIYEYPSLKLHRILRDGTEEAYSHLDFSPKGDKLASVGSAPDYMLTVWDWKNEQVILRSKAFSQDIYKVAFSPEDEGHLCTSGTGHIRFWTMAHTFTGLKLQGLIGKFGAKELSDIEGFVELPDGKVLSGSEWGNMLLWDGGLIKVEISKKGRKPCHMGMIEQFFMDEGELMTIGADGFVKVWDFESIDNADATEEGQVFEIDPMYELKVGTDVKLMSMMKAVNSEAPIWFAQDASGGIWKLDLSFTHTSHAPEKMYSYHAGPIAGLDTSPVAPFVATTGVDHTVRVYDYLTKTPMCHAKYNSGGTSLLWVPKVVDNKGNKVLAGFADGVVRLLALNKVDPSQVRSKKSKLNFELNLEQVFKPHTKAVNALSIDDQGELLATGSDDCTVFFFSVGERFKPIGFIETASPVVSLEWSKKRKVPKSVLISCKDGTVLHVEAPVLGKYDTSKTFHLPLDNLKTIEYHFKTVKEKLRKAEEEAQKAKEEEEKRKKKEEERARRRARGLQDEEEEEKEEGKKEREEDEEEKQKEEETKVELHREPGEIIKGFYYGKTDKFWLTMDGWDAGYLYQCEFDDGTKPTPAQEQEDTRGEPVKAIPVDNSDEKPIRSVCFSHSGKFMMLGMDNGVVRIHPLDQNAELEHLNSFWCLTVHDNQHGGIRHIKTSFDDKYVFTAGMDGNFFVFRFMDEAVKGLKISSKLSLPSAEMLIGEEGEEIEKKVDDIDDPNHYSIELEKQKAEHDRMVKLAEEKKQNIRRKIANLRRAFKELFTKNQNLPAHVQLTQKEFIIDPDLIKEQKVEVENKIELVRKEMAWEAEKHSIGLKKLQKRFKDEIECERIVLRAFLTPHFVSAFRASKPDYLHRLLEESTWSGGEGPDGGGHGRKSFSSGVKAGQMKRRGTQEKMPLSQQQQQQQQQQAPQSQGQLGSKVAKALEKAEARRQKRLARQAQWDDLYRNKPDEGYQDPKDVTAIKEARENMGDYKLKTAKDYVVPESQRVNAEKKRIQLLHLLDQIHHYKFEFNQRFLAQRNQKINIIKEMKETVVKLEEVQRKMDPYSKRSIPKIPEMMPDECPEKRLEYTRDQLLQFKKEMNEKTQQLHADEQGGGFGGFGGGSSSEHPKLAHHGSKPSTQQRDRSISSVSVHSSGRPKSSLSTLTDKGTPEPAIEEIIEEPSPLELEMQYEEQIRLQYEQDVLIDKINATLEKFDADLRTLRHDKMHLEIALKCADLRQVTLFEEFMLLKEFEKRENIFANKVNNKLNEKEEMQEKVEDCQMQLDSKKQDIEKLQEQEKSLYATFSSALGENNKFESFLTRVFKKKIKRAKKKTQAAEGSDEESEDEDSDEDLSSSDEEDSDAEELDDSVCPPGCDQSIFEQVCQLRERRLDLEEELTEEKKTSDTLKKEYDALVKKSKVIDSALKTAEADLEAFQREKQQKLNELDVVVVLRLSQIQYMLNGCLPQDLSQCLVFSSPDLVRLQHRIKELEKEKAEQKRLYREHRQTHVQLIRDKQVQESRIDELEEKVRNMLMLKFGRLVDLEKLETVSVNRTVEELKEKLRQQESKSAAEIAKWNGKIDSYKSKVTQLTRENTQRLDTFTVLLQEKKELENMLNSRQKSLGTEFTGSRKADIRERQRLVQLVQLQAQEIDALKDEITLLSRKGGHILPPAQPPLPPGQTPIPNQ